MEWVGFIAANLVGLYLLIAVPFAGFAAYALTNSKAMLIWLFSAIPGAALLYWAWTAGPLAIQLVTE